MTRVAATIAGLLLFVLAVDVALTFARPSDDPPTAARTIRLFMALGALPAAGLATYMAGAGEYRIAIWAALVAGALLVMVGVGELAS
jgi:hypothetical protein